MAVDHETMLGWLTRLKLTAIRDQLDSLLDEAARQDLTLREALAFLCGREIARKDERRIEMAMKIAHFPHARELASFDFDAQPSVDPLQIRELSTARWVAHGEAVLLLGPPGVGKSHLAIALGREVIRQNYTVLSLPPRPWSQHWGRPMARGVSRNGSPFWRSQSCSSSMSWATYRSTQMPPTCSSSWYPADTSGEPC